MKHLKSLQALELAVRCGSLKAAAQELSISPAAVGQRIKALEDYLNLDLLVRGRSGIKPTKELDAAMSHLTAAFRELKTVSEILDFQRVQEIHIASDTDFAELWLRPRIAEFKKKYPNILFCINGIGDIPVRVGQADCEFWFGMPRNDGDEYPLFKDYLLPVCTERIADRLTKLPAKTRLEGFPLLHLDSHRNDPDSIGWPEWSNAFGYRKTATNRGVRYNHVINALEAVYSNSGLLICGLALISRQLDAEKLSTPFARSEGKWTGHGYHINFRGTVENRPQLLQFREWLLAEAKNTENYLLAFLQKPQTDKSSPD